MGDHVAVRYKVDELIAIVWMAVGLTIEGYCMRVIGRHIKAKLAAAPKRKAMASEGQ